MNLNESVESEKHQKWRPNIAEQSLSLSTLSWN